MTAAASADVAAALAGELGGTVSEGFGPWTVDVPADQWVPTLLAARDRHGMGFFDWLSAVDELADGFSVVCHLVNPDTHAHVLVRTRVPAEEPVLATATTVFRGAAWHERETFEMFGIGFDGHADLRPLLLPEGFEGRPLRKDFVLAARVGKPWPGAKEPGESDGERQPTRRRMLPPGVPDPAVWGPRPPGGSSVDPAAGERTGSGADTDAPDGAEP
jgi:NADH-quinone oxidoreductase subunit C